MTSRFQTFPTRHLQTGSGLPERSPMFYVRNGRNRPTSASYNFQKKDAATSGTALVAVYGCVIRMCETREFDTQRNVTHAGMLSFTTFNIKMLFISTTETISFKRKLKTRSFLVACLQ